MKRYRLILPLICMLLIFWACNQVNDSPATESTAGVTDTDPSPTESEESEPAGTNPNETDPPESNPTDTNPNETDPAETNPIETDPAVQYPIQISAVSKVAYTPLKNYETPYNAIYDYGDTPVSVIHSYSDLLAFRDRMDQECYSDVTLEDFPRYEERIAEYDEAWFETHSLFLLQVSSNEYYRGSFVNELQAPELSEVRLHRNGNGTLTLRFDVLNTPCRYESAVFHLFVEIEKSSLPSDLQSLDELYSRGTVVGNLDKSDPPPESPPAPCTRPDSNPILLITDYSYQTTYVKNGTGVVSQYLTFHMSDYDSMHSVQESHWWDGEKLLHDYSVTAYGFPSYYSQAKTYDETWFEDHYLIIVDGSDYDFTVPEEIIDICIYDGNLQIRTRFSTQIAADVPPNLTESTEDEDGFFMQQIFVEIPKSAIPEKDRAAVEETLRHYLEFDYTSKPLVPVFDATADNEKIEVLNTQLVFSPIGGTIGGYVSELKIGLRLIETQEKIESLLDYFPNFMDIQASVEGLPSLKEQLEAYSESWFEDHALLLIESNNKQNGLIPRVEFAAMQDGRIWLDYSAERNEAVEGNIIFLFIEISKESIEGHTETFARFVDDDITPTIKTPKFDPDADYITIPMNETHKVVVKIIHEHAYGVQTQWQTGTFYSYDSYDKQFSSTLFDYTYQAEGFSSMESVLAAYDEAWFEENALVACTFYEYVEGYVRPEVKGIYYQDGMIWIDLQEKEADEEYIEAGNDGGDTILRILIEVPKASIPSWETLRQVNEIIGHER